jgi:hypothetical protein
MKKQVSARTLAIVLAALGLFIYAMLNPKTPSNNLPTKEWCAKAIIAGPDSYTASGWQYVKDRCGPYFK